MGHPRSYVCFCLFITFGSHRKLDPGRRCPRQPHRAPAHGDIKGAAKKPARARAALPRDGGTCYDATLASDNPPALAIWTGS